MAGPWLYAISKAAGCFFDLNDGSIPVTVESYRNLVENGRIDEVRYWGGKHGIRCHWQDVADGDELFIYTGDKNLGIIGYATISKKVVQAGRRCLVPTFDLDKCRALLDKPVPAWEVRKWRRALQGNVIDLGTFQNTLNARLPWSRSRRDADRRER